MDVPSELRTRFTTKNGRLSKNVGDISGKCYICSV